jgi:hypothetical protein
MSWFENVLLWVLLHFYFIPAVFSGYHFLRKNYPVSIFLMGVAILFVLMNIEVYIRQLIDLNTLTR